MADVIEEPVRLVCDDGRVAGHVLLSADQAAVLASCPVLLPRDDGRSGREIIVKTPLSLADAAAFADIALTPGADMRAETGQRLLSAMEFCEFVQMPALVRLPDRLSLCNYRYCRLQWANAAALLRDTSIHGQISQSCTVLGWHSTRYTVAATAFRSPTQCADGKDSRGHMAFGS